MFFALTRAWGDLWSPRFRAVLWQCIGLSLATAVAVLTLIFWLIASTDVVGSLPWVGGAVDLVIDVLGWIAAVALTIVLLPAFLGLYASFYIEAICRAVEARHYPGLPAARDQSVREAIATGVKFLVVLILANILLLPLLFFPPVYFVAGWAINGHLLGREYMEMVGFRRLDPGALRTLRARHRNRIFFAGLLLAAIATIPVANLLLPLFAPALMLHIFERLRIGAQR